MVTFAMDIVGMSERLDRGREGFSKKEGSGPVNWKRDRRNRYAVMGAQTMGTTYHSVRVHIFRRRDIKLMRIDIEGLKTHLKNIWSEQPRGLLQVTGLMYLLKIVGFATRELDTEIKHNAIEATYLKFASQTCRRRGLRRSKNAFFS